MEQQEIKKYLRVGLVYRLFKRYVRFIHDKLLYRHVYYINRENVPPAGTPVIVVSNHQNCANDPLGLVLGFENSTHPYVIARGDVFQWNKKLSQFFKWIGMLPAFRLHTEGADSLSKNEETIRISGGELLKGHRLIIYPEGTHMPGHWLGEYSLGYTRMAFQTAEMDNFQTEIFILPSCNHYSSYFGLQEDFMVKFGTPISLKPYYERYKTKPRTVQREVNKLVLEQVKSLMLNITDAENYEAIDFLRLTYGRKYAVAKGYNPDYLPDKLEADKDLFRNLELVKANDAATVQAIYADALALKQGEANLKLTDAHFDKQPNVWCTIGQLLVQIVLLPLWIVSLWPSLACYRLPYLFLHSDVMFTNSLVLILNVLLFVPLFLLATFLVAGLCFGWWWQAAVWVLLFPAISMFAWYDWQWMKRTFGNLRFMRTPKSKVAELRSLRERMHAKLNEILGV